MTQENPAGIEPQPDETGEGDGELLRLAGGAVGSKEEGCRFEEAVMAAGDEAAKGADAGEDGGAEVGAGCAMTVEEDGGSDEAVNVDATRVEADEAISVAAGGGDGERITVLEVLV